MKNVLDIHSHILPGVDDGAESLEDTMFMLRLAKQAGLTSIIATPHLKTQATDVGHIRNVFREVKPLFDESNVELRLGFECHYGLLLQDDWDMRSFQIADTNVVLLEFSSGYLPLQWENSIGDLQRIGLDVIIAHPERYVSIQENIEIAQRMIEIGCELQLSAGSLYSGFFSTERKCALKLLDMRMVGYIASDAHCAQDYRVYAQAIKKFGSLVRRDSLLTSDGWRT